MQTPDPLPQPGAWLVMADGSVYEVVEPTDEMDRPTGDPAATADGVYYLAVDAGELIWTPWSDVEAVAAAYEDADPIAAAIVERDADRLDAGNRPRVIAHTTRWDVTIYHAPHEAPPAYLRAAVQAVIQATLRAAGIDGAAVLITEEA